MTTHHRTKDIKLLRASISNIVKILANHGNAKKLTVTQQGSSAFVATDPHTLEPVRLNLPYIPDDASANLINAINGFLDHEVGHIFNTDFSYVKKAVETSELLAGLHNIVEDPFIERKMQSKFRGSGYNLRNVQKFFIEKITDPNVKEAVAANDQQKIFSYLLVPAIRGWSGQDVFNEYMTDNGYWKYVEEFRKMCHDLIAKLPSCNSTADTYDIAYEMYKRWHSNEQQQQQQQQQQQPKQQGKKCKDGEPQDGESESQGGDGDGEPQDGEDGEPQDGKGESQGGDGDGQSKDKKAGDDLKNANLDSLNENEDKKDGKKAGEEGDDGDGDGEEGGKKAGEEGDGDGDGKSEGERPRFDLDGIEYNGQEVPPITKEVLESLVNSDFDGALIKIIGDEAVDEQQSSAYLPYTTDHDEVSIFKHREERFRESDMDNLETKSQEITGVLQSKLQRLVLSQNKSHWNTGLKKGKLNTNSLYKIRAKDYKVFRRKEETRAVNTAVTMLIDCSGSMGGDPLREAVISAYSLAKCLDKLKLPFEVLGFTTKGSGRQSREDSERFNKEMSEGKVEFGRTTPIYIPIFKDYSEPFGPVQKRRLAAIENNSGFLGNNVDGESVQIAGERLLRREETKRILIVLSDGYPTGGAKRKLDAHLKSTVNDLTKAGLNVIGIGIQSEAVKQFYPQYTVLNEFSDLPIVVMDQLKKFLL